VHRRFLVLARCYDGRGMTESCWTNQSGQPGVCQSLKPPTWWVEELRPPIFFPTLLTTIHSWWYVLAFSIHLIPISIRIIAESIGLSQRNSFQNIEVPNRSNTYVNALVQFVTLWLRHSCVRRALAILRRTDTLHSPTHPKRGCYSSCRVNGMIP
jgi:hypothetical protein